MDNAVYSRLYDALTNDRTREVAHELLALPKSDVGDFFLSLVNDAPPLKFRAGRCVRLMREIEGWPSVTPSGLEVKDGLVLGMDVIRDRIKELHAARREYGDLKDIDFYSGEVLSARPTVGRPQREYFQVENGEMTYRGHKIKV